MDRRWYFGAFSLEELCEGAELVLSGECRASYSPIGGTEKNRDVAKPFVKDEVLSIALEYDEFVKNKKKQCRAGIVLDISRGCVLSAKCACSDFRKDRYGCSHTAAALTAWFLEKEGAAALAGTELETRLKNRAMVDDPFEPGVLKRTDSRLLPLLRAESTAEVLPVWEPKVSGKRECITSEYEIVEVGGEYELSLRAGTERLYVVKDLPTFIRAYRDGGLYTFGKVARQVTPENCDAFTGGLLELLNEALVLEELGRNNMKRFVSGSNPREIRSFRLSGQYMGRFLSLLEGKSMAMSDGSFVPVDLSRKGLEATIQKRTHGAVMQMKKLKLVAADENTLYLQDKKGIFSVPCSEEINAVLRDILFLEGPLYVRESDLPTLKENVIPAIEENGTVKLKGLDFSNYEREKPDVELYLDIEDRSRITCVPYAAYHEPDVTYRLFDNASGNERRNAGYENAHASYLKTLFEEYDPTSGTLSAVLADDQLFEYLQDTVPKLKETASVFISDRLKNLKVRPLPKLQMKVGVKPTGLMMDLRGTPLTKEEMEEILLAYSPKRKYFRLKNGEFFNLEETDMEVWDAMADLFRHHGAKDATLLKLPLYRAVYLSEMLKDRDDLVLEADDRYRELVRTMGAEERTDVPASLAETLRPYQVDGFHWIRRLKSIGFGGILADDMGLGKTLQILAFVLSEKLLGKSGEKLRTLIVCPASLVYNWKKELEHFTPELSSVVIAGTQSVRQQLIESSLDTDVWITSYDLMKRDVAYYEGVQFANEIIDEAQFIKNQHTQAAQSVRIVSAEFRMALTGTPIENHLGELWSILDYLMPGFLYSYTRFQAEFQTPIADGDEECMERLRKMVHPFILRRLKKDVLKDLPDKLEEAVVVKLEGGQKDLYDAYATKIRQMLAQKNDAEFRSQKLQVLSELTHLRQICCDPALFVNKYNGGSAKLEACMELLAQAVEGGHKVLLFSQFTSMLDILGKRISEAGYQYYRLDGSVSKEKRMEMVDNFAYDDVPIFCISLKAGGTGLNLTAADIVIHYDPWWNQAAQNQATDRAHRIGQEHSVTVYELIAEDTIEERIMSIKQGKAKLMEEVLSGEGISASTIERGDLMMLLE